MAASEPALPNINNSKSAFSAQTHTHTHSHTHVVVRDRIVIHNTHANTRREEVLTAL